MIFKLWLWIFEFRLRRKRDDDKISFIVRSFLSELEGQDFDLDYHKNKGTAIFLWLYEIDNSVRIEANGWRLECGKYIPKKQPEKRFWV